MSDSHTQGDACAWACAGVCAGEPQRVRRRLRRRTFAGRPGRAAVTGRRAAALLGGALGAAIFAAAAELALRSVPRTQRPFSGPVRPSVEVAAPIEAVWATLADIPGQVRWMPEMKRVAVLTPGPVRVGSVCEATIRILGIAVTDPVTITTYRPPTAFGIEHGGLFGGRGILRLTPSRGGAATVVRWTEYLVPPLFPALGWLVSRPITGFLYQRDLDLLRALVEDARVPAAA